MRFTVSSGELNAQLQTLSKVIANKSVYAILDCFLFEIADGKMKITASDGENMMVKTIPIEDTFVAGSFALPNRTILDAMKEIPDQPLTFDVNTEDLTVKVLYQNGMYNLTASNANEYPVVKGVGDGASVVTIDASILVTCISRSMFATAQDEIRPVMNGVFFDLTPESLSIVTSDGHKLVRNRNYSVKSETPTSFILPKKPANILKAALDKAGGDVVIKYDDSNALITFGNGSLVCCLINGRYPNYNAIIPKNNPNQLTIDRRQLLSAIRRILPFSGALQLIRFQLEPGKLELRSQDIDFAMGANEKLACTYANAPMAIGFKGGSLVEILSSLESDEVTIQLSDPIRAGLIMPAQQPENEEIIILIMPILLND